MLVTEKFDLNPDLPNRKPNGLFSCTDCIYHENGYIKPCKDVLYILICNNCDYFYLGKTIDFKQRILKHKSNLKHPQNSTYRECAEHLRDWAKTEPFFSDLFVL